MPDSREDCFFCMTETKGYNSKNRSQIRYMYTNKVIPATLIQTNCGRSKEFFSNNCEAQVSDKDSDMELSAGEDSSSGDEDSSASNEEHGK